MGAETAFIVNPIAGHGRGARVARDLRMRLRETDLPHSLTFTDGSGHATALTQEALRNGARTVVAVGGDGTANEVVNGFFGDGRPIAPGARVAFVPAGTGNDFGRQFPLPDSLHLPATATHLDVLRVRYAAPGENGPERYALFHVAVGLVSEVTAVSNRYKDRLGSLAYAAGAVEGVLRHQARTVRCSCDGGPPRTQSLDLIFAANSRYAGGGMLFAPMASMQDGLLDLLSVRSASKWFIVLRLLPAVYRGTHLRYDAVEHVQARRIHLASDEPLPVEMDGELVGTTPVWIDVLPRALPVCV